MTRRLLILCALMIPLALKAAGGGAQIEEANNNLRSVQSLQRGAGHFVNYCMGCHSLDYVRFNRLSADLQLSEDQVTSNLMFVVDRPHDTMEIAMRPTDGERWFGIAPPDLSLMARAKGTDYIYTFLKSFYADDSKRSGTDNLVLEGASMPHVLWELQGLQKPVYEAEVDARGEVHKTLVGFEPVTEGTLSGEEFDHFVRDLANFLEYVSEPVKLERQTLGVRVLMFLLLFFLFAYALKKEYWKNIN